MMASPLMVAIDDHANAADKWRDCGRPPLTARHETTRIAGVHVRGRFSYLQRERQVMAHSGADLVRRHVRSWRKLTILRADSSINRPKPT